jgi:hypothetical protein
MENPYIAKQSLMTSDLEGCDTLMEEGNDCPEQEKRRATRLDRP